VGWYTAYVKQNQKVNDKFDVIQKWIATHEKESDDRRILIQQVAIVIAKAESSLEMLGKLSDISARRLERLEAAYFVPKDRSER
jgi:hypothetical protein